MNALVAARPARLTETEENIMTKINEPDEGLAAREAEARSAMRRMAADENKARVANLVRDMEGRLLQLTMQSANALSDYSFKDIGQLGRRLVALSKTGKPGEKIGKLSEVQIRSIWPKQ